jgi:uncharacterized protein YoxC
MLPVLFAAQAVATEPSWIGPTIAISLVVIALSFMGMALALVAVGKNTVDLLQGLQKEVGELREELAPAIRSMTELADEGKGLASKVQQEIHDVVRTSQRVRHDVERGMAKAKRRLSDLDALAEVVQEEIEDTALDVTAKLMAVRHGLGIVGRLRRRFAGGAASRRRRIREE